MNLQENEVLKKEKLVLSSILEMKQILVGLREKKAGCFSFQIGNYLMFYFNSNQMKQELSRKSFKIKEKSMKSEMKAF